MEFLLRVCVLLGVSGCDQSVDLVQCPRPCAFLCTSTPFTVSCRPHFSRIGPYPSELSVAC